MRLALTLSAALMGTALAFVPPMPSARRGTKLVSPGWGVNLVGS